ncbi:hypothetical protein ROLI_016060 [Roseobacter fucihabitans]|uniref:Uncharacterized protein n=1 Tax=Roseobacter fucihabitans TaxID=1537242 RepID=A0ABZ2BSW1_9RHOB
MHISNNGFNKLSAWIRDEITFPGPVARGKRGMVAKRVQEWLCLHHHQVAVDADFGGVTEDAVKDFQQAQGIKVTGSVDKATHAVMVAPMIAVLSMPVTAGMTLSQTALAFSKVHLAQHPLEVGGANAGPWVRLYMEGNEGRPWAWCAGFTSFCMHQAAQTLGKSVPIRGSFSCDTLAAQAKKAGRFLAERDAKANGIPAGSLFLVRRTSTDWTHVGFVSAAQAGSFQTIEGNTNDDGDREGYEVCARRRGYGKKDFILL